MKRLILSLCVLAVCIAPQAHAADDGQTQPRLNFGASNSHTVATDIIATTNGTGNVKGVHCLMYPNPNYFNTTANPLVKFYINGGAAQTITIDSSYLPSIDSTDLTRFSGWVPLNLRFTTSIRVTVQKDTSTGGDVYCGVSWALD